MCYTAKASVTAWWILAMMSLFLWYRNEKYDRALAIFIFTLGIIQLIEYGIHSGADPDQSGRALFITLWLQCLVLTIGVFVFITSSRDPDNISTQENIIEIIAGWMLVLFVIIFIAAVILSYTLDFSASPGSSGHIEWYMDGMPFFGKWGFLYLVGIFGPLILLFGFYDWSDPGIAVLIIYGLLSFGYVSGNYPSQAFTSMFCYLSVGFAFLAWWTGIIPDSDKTSC